MDLSEWNRSARSWAVNKLRAANKRASLRHRWTVVVLQRWNIWGPRRNKGRCMDKQRQANGNGNAFSCRICMS